MTNVPSIIVQLVHIEGPLKGEIQEFSDAEILIGRHSTCQVRFPKDLAIISRKHARIVREGNRFKLVDESANGTMINGKFVEEAWLKDGDVLIFSEGGPKVSFLTQVDASMPAPPPPPPPQRTPVHQPPKPSGAVRPPAAATPAPSRKPPAPDAAVPRAQAPLIVQYGPTLQSYKELPVTIGKKPSCNFVIDHPGVLDTHLQIYFKQDQYWVKDLTGQRRVKVDHRPIDTQAELTPQCRLSLSDQGPHFRFLGAGRLAEIEDEPPAQPEPKPTEPVRETPPPQEPKKGKGKFFKKMMPKRK